MSPKFGFKVLAGALLAASSAAALASQAWSVDLQDGAISGTPTGLSTVRNYVTGSGAEAISLSATAYSNTGTNKGGTTLDNNNDNLLESAYLYHGDGWGGLASRIQMRGEQVQALLARIIRKEALPSTRSTTTSAPMPS